jgi:hypothetical protein
VITRAEIKGPAIPIMEVTVSRNDNPLIRSRLLRDLIKIISEDGLIILPDIASQLLIRIQKGQVFARKRSKPVGKDNNLPKI